MKKHRIENFYTRARDIIDNTYGSDTEDPFYDSWDNLEKEFGNNYQKIVLLQYNYDSYEPDDIAYECLEMGMRHKIIDHTEISLSDWNSIFVVVVVKKTKDKTKVWEEKIAGYMQTLINTKGA